MIATKMIAAMMIATMMIATVMIATRMIWAAALHNSWYRSSPVLHLGKP